MENIVIKSWYNYDGTNDFWIYDLNKSSTNPVSVYVSVAEKHTVDYVKDLFKKEHKQKHLSKPAPVLSISNETPQRKRGGDFLDEFFVK